MNEKDKELVTAAIIGGFMGMLVGFLVFSVATNSGQPQAETPIKHVGCEA